MLGRVFAGVLSLAVLVSVLVVAPAHADDPPADCDPYGNCTTNPRDPGSPGTEKPGGGGGQRPGSGGPRVCKTAAGVVVDCYDPRFGWWDSTSDCYFKLAEPQPPKSDPI